MTRDKGTTQAEDAGAVKFVISQRESGSSRLGYLRSRETPMRKVVDGRQDARPNRAKLSDASFRAPCRAGAPSPTASSTDATTSTAAASVRTGFVPVTII